LPSTRDVQFFTSWCRTRDPRIENVVGPAVLQFFLQKP
jgi:hypothetical protein